MERKREKTDQPAALIYSPVSIEMLIYVISAWCQGQYNTHTQTSKCLEWNAWKYKDLYGYGSMPVLFLHLNRIHLQHGLRIPIHALSCCFEMLWKKRIECWIRAQKAIEAYIFQILSTLNEGYFPINHIRDRRGREDIS